MTRQKPMMLTTLIKPSNGFVALRSASRPPSELGKVTPFRCRTSSAVEQLCDLEGFLLLAFRAWRYVRGRFLGRSGGVALAFLVLLRPAARRSSQPSCESVTAVVVTGFAACRARGGQSHTGLEAKALR